MVPLPPLRDGGCALPICPFGRACLPLISDAPDCTCSPGRLWFLGDGHERTVPLRRGNFNPRAPCGARLVAKLQLQPLPIFQSTRPVWGATMSGICTSKSWQFQSTRPVWGATRRLRRASAGCVFQSTRPVWGATRRGARERRTTLFQSTRPVWGATNSRASSGGHGIQFQSTRPVWGAT